MALLVPNVGEEKLLEVALNSGTQGDQTLHLYENNYTPVEASVLASFTESTAGGYASKILDDSSWSITPGGGDPTVATYAQQTFTFTATGTSIYGYYVLDVDGTTILWAEKFAGAEPVYNGKVLKVTPAIELA